MDADRREHLAARARVLLPRLRAAVVDSWADLMPAATSWNARRHARGVAATDAVLAGIADVILQGDVDDRRWLRTAEAVYGRGHVTADEAKGLLRTIRVVGVGALLDELEQDEGLTPDERWALQLRAQAFCEQLHGVDDEVEPGGVDRLLADLERDGPDYGAGQRPRS
jgi:hypothetical protein